MADEPAEPTIDDVIAEAEALARNQRAWLKTVVAIIAAYSEEPGRSEPVQSALDSLVVTACARAKRILRSDLRS